MKIQNYQNKKSTGRLGKLCTLNFKLLTKGGFTLVETLVAISVLMVAVASPLTIAQKSLSSALYAKDQTTAFFLAQDAVEYLKYVRLLESDGDWTDAESIANCISSSEGTPDRWCRVDTRREPDQAFFSCDANPIECPRLTFNTEGRVYGHEPENGTTIKNSLFSRRFTLIPVTDQPDAMRVLLEMRWLFGALGERDITINTLLYNWR